MVCRQVTAVHGLVMRDPVPEPTGFVEFAMERLTAPPVLRECAAQRRPPKPGLIIGPRSKKRHPEAERQLGDHSIRGRDPVTSTDLVDCIRNNALGHIMQAQTRRIPPVGTTEKIAKPLMQRVPAGYLEAPERSLKSRRYLDIPSVQPHCRGPVTSAGSEVRGDPCLRCRLLQHVELVHGASLSGHASRLHVVWGLCAPVCASASASAPGHRLSQVPKPASAAGSRQCPNYSGIHGTVATADSIIVHTPRCTRRVNGNPLPFTMRRS